MVVVLLRGAYDGLSAFVPYADADYYASRPNIGIAAPDGSTKTALKLDNTFALHPALAPVLPLWQQGVLSFIPSAGLPAPNRSHFAAQYEMETGQSGKSSVAPGWLNKAADSNRTITTVIGVGEANPAILAGEAQVKLIPEGAATRLDYTAKANVGGKLAQIGSRLVDAASKKMADDFFVKFNAELARRNPAAVAHDAPVAHAAAPAPYAGDMSSGGLTALAIALGGVVAAIAYFLSRL